MCTGRCPSCGYYSCSCSEYKLRRYQDDHRFTDYSAPVLSRWAQDDANERVECELRDRRRREEESEEQERRERQRAREQREERERQQEYEWREEEYRRQQEEEERQREEDDPDAAGGEVGR